MSVQLDLDFNLHVYPLLELARFAAEANDVLIELDCVMKTRPELRAVMSGITTVDAERSEVGGLISSTLWVAREILQAIEARRAQAMQRPATGAGAKTSCRSIEQLQV